MSMRALIPCAVPLLAFGLAACSAEPEGTSPTPADETPTASPPQEATQTQTQAAGSTPTATEAAVQPTATLRPTEPPIPTQEPQATPTEEPPPTPTGDLATATPGPTPTATAIPAGGSAFWVGAAWKSLLPTVQGTTGYFDELRTSPLALTPGDPGDDPGVFVRQWDVGTIGIGNGNASSHWVHDEIRGTAVAFQDRTRVDHATVVLVAADLYMLFGNDMQAVHEKLIAQIGQEEYDRLHILISASHTHEGPDTAGLDGPINHDYYEYLTTQLAAAIADAVADLQPAELVANTSSWQFGLGDTTSPRIVDPTLNTLQARNPETGAIIATVAQWSNHPEAVLFYDAPVKSQPQCAYLQGIDEAYEYEDDNPDTFTCTFEGQFISADFPGIMAYEIMEATGAPALYLNGTVGSLMSPLRVAVWEVEGATGKPVGDGITVPEGAATVPRNFRKMAIIGQELAKKVLADVAAGQAVERTGVDFATQDYYTHLSNIVFRLGLSPRPGGSELPLLLGNTLRELYDCDPERTECVSDDYATSFDQILGVPIRVGDYIKTTVHRIRIGDVGILSIPGEMAPEMSHGLPHDFYDNNGAYYFGGDAAQHTTGADYKIDGYIRAAMDEPFKWVIGLAEDELGYMVPLSDYRVYCVAGEDKFADLMTSCDALYASGAIQYPDSASGARCKEITENPQATLGMSQTDRQGLVRTCQYGLTFGEADGHYPETNSVGWSNTGDYFEVVRTLTEYGDPWPSLNPAFDAVNFETANP